MKHKLFYIVMQHMWIWGYKIKADSQPCLLMEYVEGMLVLNRDLRSPINESEETAMECFAEDMDQFIADGTTLVDSSSITFPMLSDIFEKA